jgi:hypothetical protein
MISLQTATIRFLMRVDVGDLIFTAAMLVCVWLLCRKLERLIEAVKNIHKN